MNSKLKDKKKRIIHEDQYGLGSVVRISVYKYTSEYQPNTVQDRAKITVDYELPE